MIISYFGKSLQQPSWGDLFKDEVRVSDAGVEYWIPIQSSTLPAFRSEVGAGGRVELYVAFLGCYPQHSVIGINEFFRRDIENDQASRLATRGSRILRSSD